MASGYVINAKPGPDDSAYLLTVSFNSADKNPMVANTAKPAKIPVKQSHDTTIHICLINNIINLVWFWKTTKKRLPEKIIFKFIR
jgi:hypothetical protein